MGFFSSYVGGSAPTKQLVAGRVSALIRCVIDDIGMDGLNAGRIILSGDFTVSFRGSHFPSESSFFASVNTRELTGKLLTCNENYVYFRSLPNLYSDTIDEMLVQSVINEFEKQSLEFAGLPRLLKPVGKYVFVAKSKEFREAEIKKQSEKIMELLQNDTWTHYLMETYENPGSAKVREMHEKDMKSYFVDGIIESYELSGGF